ncbi:MAG: insulinase family protein [Bacteroidales bacterium]|nr:insulinase family protein [Bacteroidales bacterium]
MRRFITRTMVAVMALGASLQAWAYRYQYETYDNDPLKGLVYTLPNGLKVYTSVNKDKPRIQTNIAVRVGSKNDPPETTGLAHYFEHMMFKGTEKFGTSDYAAEKPMLDQIETLFETYRATTDSTARAGIYHQIDSISYLASQIAIPNEYDKLMAAIGAEGTNAYTSYDYTCYVEDIPSNEIDRWAAIQADRFEQPILRGFHTELETIYEEKNMSLTQDNRKIWDALFKELFPNHPYGQWTVLGHQQHLKNPSITNIKEYHKNWYVPNNMCVILAGDFDPDNVVDIITYYFGHLKPNYNLPKLDIKEEPAITPGQSCEVWGNEAERVMLAWRIPGMKDPESIDLNMADMMLANGKAGLLDLNVNQKQLTQGAAAGPYELGDHSIYYMYATPKEGQTLDEVKQILLNEVANLRDGNFDESLIPATINNYKLSIQASMDENYSRVNEMQDIFIYDLPGDYINQKLNRSSKVTKADIQAIARKYLRDDNFVTVYKRQGKDTTELKMPKQPITPLAVNRDKSSAWLDSITAIQVAPIEPAFVDFDRDLTQLKSNGDRIPVLYTKNHNNDIFQLIYVLEQGTHADKTIYPLGDYFPLLGTKDKTPEQIKQEFYALACNYFISVQGERTFIVLTGLSESMPRAMELMEDLLQNAYPDPETWALVLDRIKKSRADRKLNQRSNASYLKSYIMYGPEQIHKVRMTNEELDKVNPADLTARLRDFSTKEHRIIYYGPLAEQELLDNLNTHHHVAATLEKPAANLKMEQIQPTETTFFLAPYDAKQIYMYEETTNGQTYDSASEPVRMLYNEYFGGGMNSIVFQEMREARSLAYSAWAAMRGCSKPDDKYGYSAFIATQNDKMDTAVEAFDQIINEMPQSEQAFAIAKNGIDARLRSERIIKDNIAWAYIAAQDLGETTTSSERLYKALPALTLDDVIKYQQDNVKGATYYIGILGDINDLDLDALRSRGKVVILTTDDIFCY